MDVEDRTGPDILLCGANLGEAESSEGPSDCTEATDSRNGTSSESFISS